MDRRLERIAELRKALHHIEQAKRCVIAGAGGAASMVRLHEAEKAIRVKLGEIGGCLGRLCSAQESEAR